MLEKKLWALSFFFASMLVWGMLLDFADKNFEKYFIPILALGLLTILCFGMYLYSKK